MIRIIRQLSLALSLSVGIGQAAHAEEIVCTGKNLIPQIEQQNPDIAKGMHKEAAATLHGKGLIWKIEKPGLKPSYLFGTIHLADPRLLELKPVAKAAFDDSSTLALEITEILDPKKLAGVAFTALQYTTYSDGTTLSDRLTDEQQKTLSAAIIAKMGLPWSLAARMKPWALMGALAMPACEIARKKAKKPVVDAYLGKLAQAQDKQIVALETMVSQLQAMDGLPEDVSLEGLMQSVSLGSRLDDLFETMIQLYLREETALVWSLMRRVAPEGFVEAQDDAQYAAFQREIVDRRNHSMAEEAEKHISKGGGAFIAVGALHLPGEQGMVNILAQKGYRLSRITQ